MVPVAFISYSHDSPAHKAWVLQLATDLRSHGIDARLDQWDLAPGQDMAAFMQRGISGSDRVLMVCSESYVKKADGGHGGVGYERLVVTSELVTNIDTKKFLPLVRNNPGTPKTPVFLGPRLYIDFTQDADYPVKLEELVRELHGVPSAAKPPVGPNPFSGSPGTGGPPPRAVGPTGVMPSGRPLLDDAWFTNNADAARSGLATLGFKGSMEVRIGLHDPIRKSQVELLNAARNSQIRTFGWPIGIVLDNRDEYRPKAVADGIRAEVAIPQMALTGRPSYDYWALRETGDFFLLQSLFEDDRDAKRIFFNSRIVRVTEAFLFAANLYEVLAVPPATQVSFRVTHRGLAGRVLASSNPARSILMDRTTTEDVSQNEVIDEIGQLRGHLVDNVRRILGPLFMLFDFMEFDPRVYDDIVTTFANGQAT